MTRVLRAIKRLARDTAGASLVEFTIVFPVFAALAFGIVDVGFMMYRWNAAAKATHAGARAAIIRDPIATGLGDLMTQYWNVEGFGYYQNIGLNCQDATGARIAANCPRIEVRCVIGTASGTCTSDFGQTHTFDDTKFGPIFNKMRLAFPELSREFVRISYKTTGLGFAGRPNLPMEVSVSIRCMTQELFFSGLYNLVAPAPPADCPAGTPRGWQIPASTTTLTSEDFKTNDGIPAAVQ